MTAHYFVFRLLWIPILIVLFAIDRWDDWALLLRRLLANLFQILWFNWSLKLIYVHSCLYISCLKWNVCLRIFCKWFFLKQIASWFLWQTFISVQRLLITYIDYYLCFWRSWSHFLGLIVGWVIELLQVHWFIQFFRRFLWKFCHI